MKRLLILLVFVLFMQPVSAMPRRDCPTAPNAYYLPNGTKVWTVAVRVYPDLVNPPGVVQGMVQGVITGHDFTCGGTFNMGVVYSVRFAGPRYLWMNTMQFQFAPGPQR